MRVGVVSDGVYGDRAYENVKRFFDAIWIEVEYPSSPLLDEVELDVPPCNLYLSYVRHPDIVLALVEKGLPTILGVSFGLGFLRQALELNPHVVAPSTLCSLEDNTGISEVDEFAKRFGRPLFEVSLEDGVITHVGVLRESPCGSTRFASQEIVGMRVSKELFNYLGLRICHYCRAPRLGRTCDKERAAAIHAKQLAEALLGKVKGEEERVCREVLASLQGV